MLAVIQGKDAIFEYLLRPKYNVFLDDSDDSGKRAIDYAVEYNQESFVIALIQSGASWYLDGDQGSILAQVVKQGMLGATKALVSKGASLKIKDNLNNNLLHFAVSAQNEHLVRYLVNMGVFTKQRNSIGKTPFDYALTDSMRKLVLRDNKRQQESPTKVDRSLRKTQGDMKIQGLGKVRSIVNIPFSDYNKEKGLSNVPKRPRNRQNLKEEDKYDLKGSQLTFTTPGGSSQDD